MKELTDTKKLEALKTVPELKLMYRSTPIKKVRLDEPEKIVKILREFFAKESFLIQEEMIIILLNNNLMPLGFSSLAKGSRTQVAFEPASIFQLVWKSGATGFIIAHNHPNGIDYPSDADIQNNFSMLKIASFFDIDYEDNIILTHDSYYSMREQELIWELG